VSVIFISHRLNEVEQCADRVVVLRDGAVVGELAKGEIAHDTMIRMMIGRDLRSMYIPPAHPAGRPVLEVKGFRTPAHAEHALDLSLRAGEILGMAGLVGAGRTEIACAVFGVDRAVAGELSLDGRRIEVRTPRDAIDHGIFLVPEDRKRSGLVLEQTVNENISLANLKAYASGLLIRAGAERENSAKERAALDIRTPSIDTVVGSLSGGNQQKVVLAKWLSMKPRVVIFDEPTRGIDVGSKSEIYRLMRGLADSGVAVLMISSDMEEVIGVSDRIVVMREGRIGGFLERSEFSEENVMRLAVGRRDMQEAEAVSC
jgi:ribose transport system ATP-binding protein